MSDVNVHVDLELQDLLDDRLPEPRRAAVAAHVAACPQCRGEFEALKFARDAMRALPNESTPGDLRTRVFSGLDAADRERQPRPRALPSRMTRRVAVAGLLATAAIVFFVVRRTPASVEPRQIADDFVAYRDGNLALEVRTAEPVAVEAYFRSREIAFPTRVFDLGMMGYQVVGGAVHEPGQRPRALFVYRGTDDAELVCQMYIGDVSNLPPAPEVREHGGIAFHVYRAGNLTMVFWQEGDVICVLTSDARPETVIDLAFAKAIKV